MAHKVSVAGPVRTFLAESDGAMTAYGLFLFATMAALAAAAVDVSNLMTEREKLQVAADTAAHAALYTREFEFDGSDVSKAKAIEIAQFGMPQALYGDSITADDIYFGYWDRSTEKFTPDPDSHEAVLVETRRVATRQNSVASFLFRMVGIDSFDVMAPAVFETYRPTCLREGFVADGIVDIQSNNAYFNGFCIHSNTYVSLNSNNYFEPGTIVSMPDLSLLDLPSSGFDSNDGLEAALRPGRYTLRILRMLEDGLIEDALRHQDGTGVTGDKWVRDYLTSTEIKTVALPGNSQMDETMFEEGRIHEVTCTGNQRIILKLGAPMKNMVLITNCPIKIGQATQFENVVLYTTNTDDNSINSPASLVIGKNDSCATDGGVQFVTHGGMSFAADMELYGSQLLALKDIVFSANAVGIEGATLIAGGMIDGTSNMSMGFCLTGMEDSFEADYFRMAY